MATRISLRYILMTPLNCLTSKTPCLVQESRLYLVSKPSYIYFSAKIRYDGNKDKSEVNFSVTIRFSDHDFLIKVGHFVDQKSLYVILDEFIRNELEVFAYKQKQKNICFFSFLAVVFYQKNLAIARKILFPPPDSRGHSELVRLQLGYSAQRKRRNANGATAKIIV